MAEFLILGCGYTGRRVARRLLARGHAVTATSRDPGRLRALAGVGARVMRLEVEDAGTLEALERAIPPRPRVLLSVPSLRHASHRQSHATGNAPSCGGALYDPTSRLVSMLGEKPERVVYLSTTGVYGDAREVDETTAPAPATERQRLRLKAEQAAAAGPWPSLVLRPAAIYGPWRGVHHAMRRGEFKLWGEGSNFVSRIHVDDLAAHAEAALLTDVTGAYPAADDQPSTSREMAGYCAELLGLPMPGSAAVEELSESRRSNRRVDGRAIRRLLGVKLRYPSYREGVPAALDAERAEPERV